MTCYLYYNYNDSRLSYSNGSKLRTQNQDDRQVSDLTTHIPYRRCRSTAGRTPHLSYKPKHSETNHINHHRQTSTMKR